MFSKTAVFNKTSNASKAACRAVGGALKRKEELSVPEPLETAYVLVDYDDNSSSSAQKPPAVPPKSLRHRTQIPTLPKEKLSQQDICALQTAPHCATLFSSSIPPVSLADSAVSIGIPYFSSFTSPSRPSSCCSPSTYSPSSPFFSTSLLPPSSLSNYSSTSTSSSRSSTSSRSSSYRFRPLPTLPNDNIPCGPYPRFRFSSTSSSDSSPYYSSSSSSFSSSSNAYCPRPSSIHQRNLNVPASISRSPSPCPSTTSSSAYYAGSSSYSSSSSFRHIPISSNSGNESTFGDYPAPLLDVPVIDENEPHHPIPCPLFSLPLPERISHPLSSPLLRRRSLSQPRSRVSLPEPSIPSIPPTFPSGLINDLPRHYITAQDIDRVFSVENTKCMSDEVDDLLGRLAARCGQVQV